MHTETSDIIKDQAKVGQKVLFYNRNNQIIKEEIYILESVTEYTKSGKKEKQMVYDSEGKISHIVKYAIDGTIDSITDLSKG